MIQVQNVSKAFGEHVILEEASFRMTPGERLGLVGRNGHGKTTLFRMLLGEEDPDTGSIVLPKQYKVGHLSQHLEFHEANVLDEVRVGLGDKVDTEGYRAEAALMGLGFSSEDLTRPASEFSGGYQIRVNLAKVLVEQPNLLLLDEPTNYLDIVSARWLERFLCEWRREMIIITHDRQFLERVTTHSMAVHRRKLRRMEGTVGKLYEQIFTEEEVHESARMNDEKKRKQEERFIERFRSKASKATLVKSRIKALERRGRMEALDQARELDFRFRDAPFHSTNMMRVEDLSFGYPGGPELVGGLNLIVEKGDRIAVIGPNGKGKTTLLNLLAGELRPDVGEIKLNPNTCIASFGQTNIARLDPAKTVEGELMDARPEMTRTEARGLAGLLMFPGDLADKKVEVLSGGERSRVLLGRLLVSPSNLLLLDEPTNHLDLESVESLLDAVDAFAGAVLLVSHSEMVLERLATRLIVFDGGKVTLFQGTYRDFLDRVGWQAELQSSGGRRVGVPGGKGSGKGGGGKDAKTQRRRRTAIINDRSREARPLERRVRQLEDSIERLEGEVKDLDAEMVKAAGEGRNDEMADLARQAKRKRETIEVRFGELETASEELDKLRASYDLRLEQLAEPGGSSKP